jgi:LmbE family N-acetylglucosaminyl deacetylase
MAADDTSSAEGTLESVIESLTLMAVHAHPDDEAIGTGGVLALAAAEGIRTVVVTCTNGELGDGPGGVKPGEEGHNEAAVVATRRLELEKACKELGVDHLEMLGYHDSGMVDWSYKDQPDVFSQVPVDEAAGRLSQLFERYRPDVVISYEEDSAYDHPDHVQTARVTLAAVAATPIPKKLYQAAMSMQHWERVLAALKQAGIEMPFPEPDPEFLQRMEQTQERITTTVDVSRFIDRKRAAVSAHASQMDETFFTGMPPATFELAFGLEHFIRAYDTTDAPLPEDDLFAGLR